VWNEDVRRVDFGFYGGDKLICVAGGPLEELELADEHWLQPDIRPSCFPQPLSSSTAPRLRQVRKRALIDLESPKLLEQLRPGYG
jgi:hypothetical protein